MPETELSALVSNLSSIVRVLAFVRENSTTMNAVSLEVFDCLWEQITLHASALSDQDQHTLALMIVTGIKDRLHPDTPE